MIFKIPALSLALFINLSSVCAQEDTTKFLADTIQYFKGNERFYLNNKRLKSAELESLLNKFNSSATELQLYRKKATPGTIVLLTGVTSGVIALARAKKDQRFFTPFTITLILGDLIGIPLMIRAYKHLKNSVKLYNLEIFRQ